MTHRGRSPGDQAAEPACSTQHAARQPAASQWPTRRGKIFQIGIQGRSGRSGPTRHVRAWASASVPPAVPLLRLMLTVPSPCGWSLVGTAPRPLQSPVVHRSFQWSATAPWLETSGRQPHPAAAAPPRGPAPRPSPTRPSSASSPTRRTRAPPSSASSSRRTSRRRSRLRSAASPQPTMSWCVATTSITCLTRELGPPVNPADTRSSAASCTFPSRLRSCMRRWRSTS